ncbi:TMEM165/GDT1 family protein [Candidatus Woesearchaeota archaeon]|nr:TMEM165/GDT1 family protein [Candidatus Woesearchaeota archaeon]
MLQDFLIPFITIALAEMGDKTQLAMMGMAARYKHTMQIFIGAMLASAVVDGSAVLLGNYISKYIPKTPISVAAAVTFIGFGIFTLARKEKAEKSPEISKKAILAAAFTLFFVSEFGDKSQLAALLFGTQYNLLLTIAGTLSAIGVLLILMLSIGKYLSRKLNQNTVRITSGLLFIGIGIATLAKALA